MTVTIAKYTDGRDIHKLVCPRCECQPQQTQTQPEIRTGTRKDPQYRVAESELGKLLRQNNAKPEVSFDGEVQLDVFSTN